ncbi:type II secretion system protein GspM [Porticoccaceae bacterium LTM1]|nr:type II secretion system protein GspM [Porticoccaceae bacterium LTM1]
MNNLSPVMQRSLALAILAVIILLVWAWLIAPVTNSYGERLEEVEDLSSRLSRYERLLDNESYIDQTLEQLEKDTKDTSLFFEAEKVALASAQMQQLINQFVSQSGAQSVSSQQYQAQPLNGTQAMGLRIQVRGEVTNLLNLLHSIESAQPIIFIENLKIDSVSERTLRVISRRRRGNNTPQTNFSMTIAMDLVSYASAQTEEAN